VKRTGTLTGGLESRPPTFRTNILESGIVEGDPGRGCAVGEGGAAEHAVQERRQAHPLSGHVREERARVQQIGGDPNVVEGASGKVDGAARLELQSSGAKRQRAVEAPVAEGGARRERYEGGGQACFLAGPELSGSDSAG
jgi:hypothetical protein